ncbi:MULTISPECIES: GNAT family N-acetyltransferase [unclassified Flavobacterium]|uniref:GNAT family N-acetyltransferase n=1 Tax=unclassified Flavobacterium TaxID=196869 RepID=UPI0012913DE0|nr:MULTISPECIES: GNAT family N-acetyltransferase [unclassified Flavobacterium]MQP53032.1 GNAT family N-acetyltransferase [Flavobacterium sp. LMO9]MQP62853.1 GNAT family N-acetyltransferase [Flavobacterium sp. LMO6]
MNLVKVNISDLPIIIDLTKKIWPIAYGKIISIAQLDYMIDKFYTETALGELMQKGHVFYLAQDDDDKYVGFVSYEINSKPNKTKIHKIYVLPETQGTGLGRQFFELVKIKAIEQDQKYIFLNVNKFNHAIHFYTKLGFTKVKDEVIDIGNGYIMDDYVMEVAIMQ